MQDKIREFLTKKKIAVVGSLKNESKVAYRIVQDLLCRGYELYPVNPNKKEVLGLKVYPSVKDLPDEVEAVDLVTPPAATEKIVRDCKDKGFDIVWMQPGAESAEAIEYCKDNGITCIHTVCVMVESL